MIEILIRYVGVKAIKMLWRRKFPKLSMSELIEKRRRLTEELEGLIDKGKYLEAMTHRRRIVGVQMKILREGFREDKRVIKTICIRIKEQKRELKEGR